MSYYFSIIGTKDNPLFEHEFGTSKHGGDGVARFRDDQRHLNQFVTHAALDLVEEAQWTTGAMYLKCIDRFQSSHVHAFITASNAKFLLLHNPDPSLPSATSGPGSRPMSTMSTANTPATPTASTISTDSKRFSLVGASSGSTSATGTAAVPGNPLSPAAEEAVRQFFVDVYESWVKTIMSPFYEVDMPIASSVFRTRVAAAGRKYL